MYPKYQTGGNLNT